MKIGIDVYSVLPGKGKGAGGHTYVRALITHLAELDRENQYYIFVNSENRGMFAVPNENFTQVCNPLPSRVKPLRIVHEQFIVPLLTKLYEIDVMHFPFNTGALLMESAVILTIHDMLGYFYLENFPDHTPRWKTRFLIYISKECARRAQIVLADSIYTKRQIVKRTGLAEEKIRVVYLGVEERGPRSIVGHTPIEGRYVLCVSAMGMHKNVDGTVRAFMRAKEKYELPHKLLIVGMKHYGYDKLLRLVHQENRGEKIAYLGYVDEETLSSLYSHTDLLLLLSLEEGFGLPVLEGMAAGVPVLAANTSSLPEIVGDAGILVDPLDTEGIADAMYECLLDQDMRSNLVIKGLERTKLFPWRRTAELTLAAYRDAFRMRRQSREVLVSDHHMVRGNGVKR